MEMMDEAKAVDSTTASGSKEEEEKTNEAARKIQATLRGYLLRCSLKSLVRPLGKYYKLQKRRNAIIRELVQTERHYITALDTIVHKFKEPLLHNSLSNEPIISTDKVNCIFGNADEILTFHRSFLRVLEESMKDWPVPPPPDKYLGELFMSSFNDDVLHMYIKYTENYSLADKILSSMNKKRAFVSFMEDCFTSIGGGPNTFLHLPSFLIKPVQRIPRYVLLLEDVVNHTDMEHIQYVGLVKSLKLLKTFVTRIDDSFTMSSENGDSEENSNETDSPKSSPSSGVPSYMKPTQSSLRKVKGTTAAPDKGQTQTAPLPSWKSPTKLDNEKANGSPRSRRKTAHFAEGVPSPARSSPRKKGLTKSPSSSDLPSLSENHQAEDVKPKYHSFIGTSRSNNKSPLEPSKIGASVSIEVGVGAASAFQFWKQQDTLARRAQMRYQRPKSVTGYVRPLQN